MTDLEQFRRAKDDFFRHDRHSPLTPAQQRHFSGLHYFDENAGLRLTVEVAPPSEPAMVRMQTSTGEVQEYERYGSFRFEVDGRPATLTLFRNDLGYFLPFVDALAGSETYGAGRYLEPEELPDGRFLVDFNLAYNPYCAYNENWSCPITPAENRLQVAIRAGEKVFEQDAGQPG
jgi:uncharacterized protein (DUF1684 family)